MAIQGSDPDEMVELSAAWTLTHWWDDDGRAALILLRNHTNPDIRRAVAVGMAGLTTPPEAIATVIELGLGAAQA